MTREELINSRDQHITKAESYLERRPGYTAFFTSDEAITQAATAHAILAQVRQSQIVEPATYEVGQSRDVDIDRAGEALMAILRPYAKGA